MKNKARFTIFVEDYNVPPHPWLFWSEVFLYDVYQMTGNRLYTDSLFIFKKDRVYWGPDKNQFTALGDYFNNRINNEKGFFEELTVNNSRALDNIENFCCELSQIDFSALSKKDLWGIYSRCHELFVDSGKWGAIPMYMEFGQMNISNQIRDDMREQLKKYGEPGIVFSKLVTPTKTNYLNKESIDVLRLANYANSNKDIWAKITKAKSSSDLPQAIKRRLEILVGKYGWMQYYYHGQAATSEYYLGLVKRYGRTAEKQLSSKKKEKLMLKTWQDKILRTLSARDKKNIRLLQEAAFIKELRKEIQIYRMNYAMHGWFVEIGKQLHCSSLQAKYLLKNEIENWLRKGIMPDINELNNRYQHSVFISIRNKETMVSGKKAKKTEELIIKEKKTINKDNKLIGEVAYPGKVRGIVRIVNAVKDLSKFNEGDILVSFSTNPSLVPAMHKAAAIITDSGGVTCHAAIVSREMKIPCIVGTKYATKIIKDGQKVEVDADKGIVRIVSKNKK